MNLSLKMAISRKPLFRYLFHVSIFGFFLLSLLAILGYIADEGLKKSERHFYERWFMLNKPIEADLLIVGNSRASFHIDPFVLDSLLPLTSYNLGISGGPYCFSEVAWNLYRRSNKKFPKLIVCNVDFLWFGTYTLAGSEMSCLPFYGDTCFNPILETFDLSFVDLYIPGMKYRCKMDVFKSGLQVYLGFPQKDSDLLIKRQGAVLYKTTTMRKLNIVLQSRHFEPDKKRIEKFCSFLDECRVNNISIVLMKTPIHSTAYRDLTGVEESFALIDSLSKTRELPLLDYTNYLIEDTTCFMDPVHLNYKGAQLLSVKLAEDIDSLIHNKLLVYF